LRADAEAACDALLMEIATPGSPKADLRYTHEQVGQLLSDFDNTRTVEQWLRAHNLEFQTTANGDFIRVSAPVAQLEKLLSAQFHDFTSKNIGLAVRRTTSISIPENVAAAIDFIGNTVRFPTIKGNFAMMTPAGTHVARQSGNVSPQTIWQFYGVANASVTRVVTQSLFESLGQNFSPADLKTFQQQFGLVQQAVTTVIGPNDPTQCSANPDNCAEANLDVQYIMAVAQRATTTFWSISASSQDPFYDWIVALASTSNPPSVHSISYGSIATEDPQNDMTRFSTEVCKLGLKGVTVMVSSGDDGVANFEARNDPSYCGFNPSFPATCPYVTAVGATQGPEFGQPEIACSSSTNGLITTGGGFSIYFPRPSYQDSAVKGYLANAPGLPPTSMFNSKGRGYPDVAVMGHNYQVVIAGSTYILSGTSASSPVFAGFITLINSQRASVGKSPIGFLNPTLYQLGNQKSPVFNDITKGENNCCAGNPGQITCCQYGFNATTGWDPLTGLGSVNFPQLLQALTRV
jgi:tripeptidyl-peptidase-1